MSAVRLLEIVDFAPIGRACRGRMLSIVRNLLTSLDLQRRVIGALIIREMHTRYGRENIGFLWVIGEPVLFCTGVAIMWSAIRPAQEHGMSAVAFIITGYNAITLWRHCIGRSVKAFEANGSLLFHRQVTTLDILAGRLAVEIAGSTVGFVITAGGAMLLGYMDPPQDIGMLYMGWFFMILFSIGTALILAGASEMSELIERCLGVVTYTSIPFSGVFAMSDWLPQKFQDVVLYSPSANAMEMIRGGWFGPTSRPHFYVTYTAICCVLMILGGLYLSRAARKYIFVM